MSTHVYNPNEYDDNAYAEAAVEMTGLPIADCIKALWDAGADPKNIESEVESIVTDTNDELKQLGVPVKLIVSVVPA